MERKGTWMRITSDEDYIQAFKELNYQPITIKMLRANVVKYSYNQKVALFSSAAYSLFSTFVFTQVEAKITCVLFAAGFAAFAPISLYKQKRDFVKIYNARLANYLREQTGRDRIN